eukprot:scpid16358/ scgid13122/ 
MSGPPPHKLQYPAPPSEDEDPSEMVIRKNALARAARKANEDKENLEKINRRINLIVSRYKRIADTSLEYLDDAEELLEVLKDPVKRKKYEEQIMVVVIGAAERNLQQKSVVLSSLNEFFTGSAEALKSDTELDSDDDTWEADGVPDASHLAVDARSQLSSATQKLQDINLSYAKMLKLQQAFPDSKKGRKKLEKALLTAQDEVQQLRGGMAQVMEDLDKANEQIDQFEQEKERHGEEVKRLHDEMKESKMLSAAAKDKEAELQTMKLKLRTAEEKLLTAGGQAKIEQMNAHIQDLQLEVQAEKQCRESFRDAMMDDHGREMEMARTEFQEKMRILMDERDQLSHRLHKFIDASEFSERSSATSLDRDPEDQPASLSRLSGQYQESRAGSQDGSRASRASVRSQILDGNDAAGEMTLEGDGPHGAQGSTTSLHGSASTELVASSHPKIASQSTAELQANVQLLTQKLATEQDKVQSGKKKLAVLKVQVADSMLVRNELERRLELSLKENHTLTHPQRSTVGAQFPSKHTTPAQSTHNMETAIQDRSAERPPSTYCDAETQTDHVQLVSISSPTPPPKSPARSVSPGNGATQVTQTQAKTPASSPRSKSAAVRRRSPTTTNGTATVGIGGNLSTKSSVTLGQHYASRPATRSRSAKHLAERPLAPMSVVRGSQVTMSSDGSVHQFGIDVPLHGGISASISEQLGMSQSSLTELLLDADHPVVKDIERIRNAIDRMKHGLSDMLLQQGWTEEAKELRNITISRLKMGSYLEDSVREIRMNIHKVLDQLYRSVHLALEAYPNDKLDVSANLHEATAAVKELAEENNLMNDHIDYLKKQLWIKDGLLDGRTTPDRVIKLQRDELDELQETVKTLRSREQFQAMEPPAYQKQPVNDWILHFTRQDAKCNECTLYRGVFDKVISPEEYAEMVLAMREYNRLPVERLQILAQRRLLREAMERNKAFIAEEMASVTFHCQAKEVLLRREAEASMNMVLQRRDDRLAREAAALSRSRQSLGKALSERMQGLEDTSDVLLVRPAFASSIRDPSGANRREAAVRLGIPSPSLSRASEGGEVELPPLPGKADDSRLNRPLRTIGVTPSTVGAPPPTAQGHHPNEVEKHHKKPSQRGKDNKQRAGVRGKKAAASTEEVVKMWCPESTFPDSQGTEANAQNLPQVMTSLIDADQRRFSYELSLPSYSGNSASLPGKQLRVYRSLTRPSQDIDASKSSKEKGQRTPNAPPGTTADLLAYARKRSLQLQVDGKHPRHARSVTLPPILSAQMAEESAKVPVMRGKKLMPPGTQ